MKILVISKKRFLVLVVFGLLFIVSLLIIKLQILHDSYQNNTLNYSANTFTDKPKIAIIIDDLGEDRQGVDEMMKINRHLTFAVMPFLTWSERDATEAHKLGYEVIVHLPLQSQKVSNLDWLGPKPIMLKMGNDEIKKDVQESINSVPYAVGANIHMGSLGSENDRVISNIMSVIKQNNFYFVDSRTTSKTVCRKVAQEFGVKFAQRNVFLEHSSKTKSHVSKQLILAGDLALEKGYAVVIGHVGMEGGVSTAEAIEETIPRLESKGIEFVYVSELFK